MADRQAFPPPVKCSATAKRTGQRCERWSIPGRLQCKLHGALGGPHGGRPAAEEQAGATLTLAQMMANNPGRPVWEVIRDTIRAVDLLFQAAQNEVAAGQVSAEHLDRMASLARQAHAMAASAVAAKALEMEAEAAARWGDLMADRLILLVGDWIGLPVTGSAVTAAIQATLGDLDLNGGRVRIAAPAGPPLMDQVGHEVAAALASRFGLPTQSVAVWFAQVVGAVANGRAVPDLPGAPVASLPPAPLPEPEPAPPAAEPEDLTLHSQAGCADEGEDAQVVEPELAEPELAEPEPEAQPRRRITTTLGSGGPAVPVMPYSYRTF